MKPSQHFFIIGAQRSGTTQLYHLLSSHPQVCMTQPMRPEPKYFIENPIPDKNEYLDRYFSHRTSAHCRYGEKSTSYYESSKVAEAIHRFDPNSKIIVIFRNPVERALSNYFFSKMHGLETRSLEDVFLNNIDSPKIEIKTSVNPFNYLGRGRYHELIMPYLNLFSKQQCHFLLFERINDQKQLEALYSFLDIDNIPFSSDDSMRNAAARIYGPHYRKVQKYLYDYYKEHNETLMNIFNFDLEIWEDQSSIQRRT